MVEDAPSMSPRGPLEIDVCVLPGGVCPGGVPPGFMNEKEVEQVTVDESALFQEQPVEKKTPRLSLTGLPLDGAMPPGFIAEDDPPQREVDDFENASSTLNSARQMPAPEPEDPALSLKGMVPMQGAVPPGFIEEDEPLQRRITDFEHVSQPNSARGPDPDKPKQARVAAAGQVTSPGQLVDVNPAVVAADAVSQRDVTGSFFTESRLQDLFTRLDKDKSGTLDRDELQAYVDSIDSIGSDLNPRFVENTLRRYSSDSSRRITFDEFCVVMCKLAAI